ncbi:MAG: hypothetical protein P8P98_05140, partial [Emcibacteraceae bacterium]|nr:hypothetical protein [Emcibacteraceae bacterium]
MALTPRLDIRQSQSLVLTPQLQQAIKMLQLSSAELVDFVADEVAQNPILEYDEKSETPDENSPNLKNDKAQADTDNNIKAADDFLQEHAPVGNDDESPLDTDFSESYDDNSFFFFVVTLPEENLGLNGSNMITGGSGNFDFSDTAIEQNRSESVSLKEHLEEQLVLLHAAPYEKIIIQYLIGLMDEAGYINEETNLIAQRCGCNEDDIDRIFTIAQTMEPLGVFARSLSECLKIQQIQADRY